MADQPHAHGIQRGFDRRLLHYGHTESFVKAHEVVIPEVERNSSLKVFKLLAEGVGLSGVDPSGFDNGYGANTATARGNTSAGRIANSSPPMDSTKCRRTRLDDARRQRNSESRMRENRLSGLMRGGKMRSWACGPFNPLLFPPTLHPADARRGGEQAWSRAGRSQ